jgi:gag-polyprotein putative aspartyl protease
MQELPRTLKILTVYGLIFVVLFLGMQWWQAEQRKPRFVTDAAGHTQMVLPRDRSGHYFWMAQINGKEVEFMVDTGATRTAISKKLADELGLPASIPPTASRKASSRKLPWNWKAAYALSASALPCSPRWSEPVCSAWTCWVA